MQYFILRKPQLKSLSLYCVFFGVGLPAFTLRNLFPICVLAETQSTWGLFGTVNFGAMYYIFFDLFEKPVVLSSRVFKKVKCTCFFKFLWYFFWHIKHCPWLCLSKINSFISS